MKKGIYLALVEDCNVNMAYKIILPDFRDLNLQIFCLFLEKEKLFRILNNKKG